MAPIAISRSASGEHIRQISRSISTNFTSPEGPSPSSYSSILTKFIRIAASLASRAVHSLSQSSHPIPKRSIPPLPILLSKRQSDGILGIPTTYANLNNSPAPGTVVGIVLGAVFGFLLALYLVYTVAQLSGGFSRTVVEEEVIRRRSRSDSRRRSRSASESEIIEVTQPSRRGSRRETIVVEETIRRTEAPPEDDIVEVIEEHSPDRRPSRRESKRASGFRTVDPAEPGGGDRPMRKVSRR